MPDDITIINLEPPIIITVDNAPGSMGPPGEFTVSATTPVSPSAGDAWYNSDNGRSYIYYNDGNTTQWVEFGNANIGGSFGTYTAYTPTWTGLTLGNGTQVSAYCQVNNFVHYYGVLTFGTTTSITNSGAGLSLPIASTSVFTNTTIPLGLLNYRDVSGGFIVSGTATPQSSTVVNLRAENATSTYTQPQFLTSLIPFTWADTDLLQWSFIYQAA